MGFDSIENTDRFTYTFETVEFGSITHIEVKTTHFFCGLSYPEPELDRFRERKLKHSVDPKRVTKQYHESSFGEAIATSFYREQVASHGTDPSWILALNDDETLKAVTEEYFAAYKRGTHHDPKTYTKQYDDLRPTLESGHLHRLIYDHKGDGYLYTVDNRPIPCDIFLHYISANIRSGLYRVGPLVERLRSQSQVRDLVVRPIESYNASFFGETCVEGYFSPTPDQMGEIVKRDCFDQFTLIREILGVESFRRESEVGS